MVHTGVGKMPLHLNFARFVARSEPIVMSILFQFASALRTQFHMEKNRQRAPKAVNGSVPPKRLNEVNHLSTSPFLHPVPFEAGCSCLQARDASDHAPGAFRPGVPPNRSADRGSPPPLPLRQTMQARDSEHEGTK